MLAAGRGAWTGGVGIAGEDRRSSIWGSFTQGGPAPECLADLFGPPAGQNLEEGGGGISYFVRFIPMSVMLLSQFLSTCTVMLIAASTFHLLHFVNSDLIAAQLVP